ncbi:MAG: L-serine ammonia-lyase, iron-sulfur-dependent, subunit alpha, partial [Sphaerochaeta sp.]|nr:L-serine ammonia-lyase, iron-sulfur-dependent, subunit alpha [Sphaerochaeta sp.]
NDVFGPVMQPGSSGSFAGTSRVGRIARHVLSSAPKRVRILFNPSSHHLLNLGNMMDDRGYLGGLQDFATDDVRLFSAHELARKAGISYAFGELEKDNRWPGSVTFLLEGKDGEKGTLVGQSVGGGMVCTYEINGFPVIWQADTYAVLAWDTDRPSQELENPFGDSLVQVSEAKDHEGRNAWFLEFSEPPKKEKIASVFGSGTSLRFFPALLPVVTTKGRKPQLFRTVEEWRDVAKERNISFVQAAIQYEKDFSGWDETRIWAYFEHIASILDDQIHSLERIGYDNAKDTPNLPIYGKEWNRYQKQGKVLEDSLTARIITYAMATNAKIPGVKIVPGPMGTGGGYLFSALRAVQESRGYSHQQLLDGLVVAAGIGALAFTHAHTSGESGCVGESGVCCAMASAAVTAMAGGDGVAVEHAASMALMANMGIPCDPIPGGKEFPCITRTVRAAVTAPLYADLALSGIDPLVPYHEVLQAIEVHRKETPACQLCGPLCGINITRTAKQCQQFLQGDLMAGKLEYEAQEEKEHA